MKKLIEELRLEIRELLDKIDSCESEAYKLRDMLWKIEDVIYEHEAKQEIVVPFMEDKIK